SSSAWCEASTSAVGGPAHPASAIESAMSHDSWVVRIRGLLFIEKGPGHDLRWVGRLASRRLTGSPKGAKDMTRARPLLCSKQGATLHRGDISTHSRILTMPVELAERVEMG